MNTIKLFLNTFEHNLFLKENEENFIVLDETRNYYLSKGSSFYSITNRQRKMFNHSSWVSLKVFKHLAEVYSFCAGNGMTVKNDCYVYSLTPTTTKDENENIVFTLVFKKIEKVTQDKIDQGLFLKEL